MHTLHTKDKDKNQNMKISSLLFMRIRESGSILSNGLYLDRNTCIARFISGVFFSLFVIFLSLKKLPQIDSLFNSKGYLLGVFSIVSYIF